VTFLAADDETNRLRLLADLSPIMLAYFVIGYFSGE